jgi:BlaI family transcriptional regulator, penicillinase repressor
MSKKLQHGLSKRERQIMEAIYKKKQASVYEVLKSIPNPPSYSAVRATLNILIGKGLLVHRREGRRYIYSPTIPHRQARQSALKQLLQTYFNNSVEEVVAALIQVDRNGLTENEYEKLIALIENAREEEKR